MLSMRNYDGKKKFLGVNKIGDLRIKFSQKIFFENLGFF